MHLDAYTLLIVTAFISTLVGILLVLAWTRDRAAPAMLWWATSFLMTALGTILLLQHGKVHVIVSIDIAHTLIILACGLVLSGARVFNGRPPKPIIAIAGSIFWIMLTTIIGESFNFADRILIIGLVMGLYFSICGWEFWHGANEVNFSRSTAAIFLLVHAVLLIVRVQVPLIHPNHSYDDALKTPGFAFMTFEALIYSVGFAFLLLAMTLERGEQRLKKIALTDALTGVSNRRAVENDGIKIVARDKRANLPTAMLAFDLDLFKRINDTFGHDMGDRVLKLFAASAQAALRPGDVFGRMGGEEFTAILPSTTLAEAKDVAERVRLKYAAAAVAVDGIEIGSTTSIGVSATSADVSTLESLKECADAALYRAKNLGRNVVQTHMQADKAPISARNRSEFKPNLLDAERHQA